MSTVVQIAERTLLESGSLFTQMAPYLLLGFAANALVSLVVPERWITHHLGKPGFRGVLWATLLGIPLPLCSCSVLPMAMGLRGRGASVGATVAFLIATPQTGVDSILVTGRMLGWPFAFFKIAAALATGLLAGVLADWLARRGAPAPAAAPLPADPHHDHAGHQDHDHGPAPVDQPLPRWSTRIRHALMIGFLDFPASLGGVLLLGILIGGLLTALIPPDALASTDPANRLLSMLAILVMAVPMYVCSTGSVPVAVGFHDVGVSQGALLIFLMAGPATNIAEITVVRKRLGNRALAVFLGVIIVASMGLGFAFENLQGLLQFGDRPDAAMTAEHAAHMQHAGPTAANAAASSAAAAPAVVAPAGLWDWLAIVALALLLLFPPLRKIAQSFKQPAQEDSNMSTHPGANAAPDPNTYEFELSGLNCDHCIRSAKHSLESLPGLESLTVNLHKAVLKGKDLDVKEVVNRMHKQGFEAHLASSK